MMNNPYYVTGLNATQTATNPVVWPTSSTTASNPDIPGSPKGQAEIFNLADAEAVWAADACAYRRICARQFTFTQSMPTSYSEQWNLAVQRTFGKDYLLTVDYIGSSNHHIFNYSNINLAALSPPAPSTTANINARRPYQSVQGNIEQYHKWGSSHYDGLEVQMKKSFTNGLAVQRKLRLGQVHGLPGLRPQGHRRNGQQPADRLRTFGLHAEVRHQVVGHLRTSHRQGQDAS